MAQVLLPKNLSHIIIYPHLFAYKDTLSFVKPFLIIVFYTMFDFIASFLTKNSNILLRFCSRIRSPELSSTPRLEKTESGDYLKRPEPYEGPGRRVMFVVNMKLYCIGYGYYFFG